MRADWAAVVLGGGHARPPMMSHEAITPFLDPSPDVNGNLLSTSLPPEQVIPAHFTDPLFIRADFNGVTLEGDYVWDGGGTGQQPSGGVTMTSGRWKGLYIPFLLGANSTPPTMIMTPMLPLYPLAVQEAVLWEHASRSLDDLIFSCEPWNQQVGMIPAQILAFVQRIVSWGFRPFLWRGECRFGVDTMFETLMQSGLISFYGHGTEVDKYVTAEAYEAGLQPIMAYVNGRIGVGFHTTCDGGRKLGYPFGFPRDTFLPDWSPYDGKLHLLSEQHQDADGAQVQYGLWGARLHVNCGIGDGARGSGAPHSRTILFECKATNQLYGQATETDGARFGWYGLCSIRDAAHPQVLPISGFGNNGRYPDGTAI